MNRFLSIMFLIGTLFGNTNDGDFFNVNKKGIKDQSDLGHVFQEINFNLDIGFQHGIWVDGDTEYKLNDYNNNQNIIFFDQSKELYSESKGLGLNLRYIIGFSVLDKLMIKSRPFLSLGLLFDSKIIFNSNYQFYNIGIGIHERVFSFLTFFLGAGQKFISKNKIVYQQFELNNATYVWTGKSKLNNNLYVFAGFGINIPINHNMDICFNINGDLNKSENTVGYWQRFSGQIGCTYLISKVNKATR